MIKEVTDATFETEVLQTPGWVLVDFYRPNCSACPMLEQTLLELQPAYQEGLKMVKLNTDSGAESAQRAGVTAHPTTVLFKDGKVAGTFVGAGVMKYYKTFLDDCLRALS